MWGLLPFPLLPSHSSKRPKLARPAQRRERSAVPLDISVQKSLERACGLPASQPAFLLVSVSGGLDSVALLLLLHRILRRRPKWRVEVVHFNHGFREESAEEEVFVQKLAEERGLRCHVRRAEEGSLEGKGGMQKLAREWRRCESEKLLPPDGFVVQAHHRDDQLETRLMQLLKGAHLARLGGMLPRDGLYLRPLLKVGKAQLRSFLEEEGQEWREDASNAKAVYKRNKVRLQVLPLLEEICGGRGGLYKRFDEIAEQSGQLASWIDESAANAGGPAFQGEAQRALRVDGDFRSLPRMVRHEIVFNFLANGTGTMQNYRKVEAVVRALRSETRSVLPPLGDGFELLRTDKALCLRRVEVPCEEEEEQAGDMTVMRFRRDVSLELQRGGGDGMLLHRVPVGATLELRAKRPTDRFAPYKGAFEAKINNSLGRVYNVAPEQRDGWPVLALREGKESRVLALYPWLVAGEHCQGEEGDEVEPVRLQWSWEGVPDGLPPARDMSLEETG